MIDRASTVISIKKSGSFQNGNYHSIWSKLRKKVCKESLLTENGEGRGHALPDAHQFHHPPLRDGRHRVQSRGVKR